jgi:hypothetical protein
MTTTEPTGRGFLHADDPNYRQYMAAAQFDPSPIARQFAAMLVATCPHGIRHDPDACAAHLQGVAAAQGLTELTAEGRRRAEKHLAGADAALDELVQANDTLEDSARQRRALPEQVVDAKPHRASRAEIRRQLAQNQQIAAQRELVGNLEHLKSGHAGPLGWVIATIVAVIETVVTMRVFNIDLSAFSWSWMPWLALTLGLLIFNHNVAGYLGEKRRAAREVHDAATRLHTHAVHRMHHAADGWPARTAARPGQVAGLAPSADQVRRARRAQWLALAIYGVPLVLLMAGLYLRMFASTERLLDLGVFGYVFPLIVVTVLASLLWALVVEPYSRGNALGDHLHSQLAVDAETVELDEQFVNDGREAAQEALRHAEAARAALMSADQEFTELAEIGHRALQIAHAALGVPTVGVVRPENLIHQPFPHRDRIGRAVQQQEARTADASARLEQPSLTPIEAADSPHSVYETPPAVVPDLAFVAPETLAPYADSTLGFEVGSEPPRRGRRALLASAVVLAVLVAGAAWYLMTQPDPVAADLTPTATSDNLVEGVDYSFLSAAADGTPAQRSCATPINVRLAGTTLAGADTALAGTVASLTATTGLPLAVGEPLSDAVAREQVPANEIAVSYVPQPTLEAAGDDVTADTLGVGGGQTDASGRIVNGWIGILGDDAATDPTTADGQKVLWHEAAHALGVGHAAQETAELMVPRMDPAAPLWWGPGAGARQSMR